MCPVRKKDGGLPWEERPRPKRQSFGSQKTAKRLRSLRGYRLEALNEVFHEFSAKPFRELGEVFSGLASGTYPTLNEVLNT